MSVLGFRGSTISVVDQVTGSAWNGRAVRVVDENPSKTSAPMRPDCAEHVFSAPADDGIETCCVCLLERGTIHPV